MCIRDRDWPRHETLAGAILGGFARRGEEWQEQLEIARPDGCLLYTSGAADERSRVDLGGGRIIKKKNRHSV